MKPQARWNVLACSLLLSACAGVPAVVPGALDGAGGASSIRRSAVATLQGRVMAPANVLGGAKLLGADGASLIGADAASLIGTDGGSLIGADAASFAGARRPGFVTARGLLALKERALAGAEVVLVDASGKPVSGVKPVTTDAEGRFRLPGVPPGAFRVQAGVRTATGVARLEALVRPDARGAADVSAATTLVTSLVAVGPKTGGMDMKRYADAVAACARMLEDGALPDWSDRAGVARAAQAVLAASAEMRPMIEALNRDADGVGAAAASGKIAAPATAPAGAGPSKASGPPTGNASFAPTSASPDPEVASSTASPPSATPSEPASATPSGPASATPAPVEEVHDPRLEFRTTEAATSSWSYHWLAGDVPMPMSLAPAGLSSVDKIASWMGGTEAALVAAPAAAIDVKPDTTGLSFVYADAQYFVLDPSTTKLEGAAAAWTAPAGGTVRIVGNVEVNATTKNGVTVSVRNGARPVVSEVLSATRTALRLDSGTFKVAQGTQVWLWAQPRAMPEETDVTRFQVQLIFTR